VADWTILAILNLLRHSSWGDRQMHAGWWGRAEMMGRQLGSLTVGIIGLGNVGGTVARRLTGFGSKVVYTDPDPSREFPGAARMELDELVRTADVVCLHAPLDVDTRGLIGAAQLAAMKPGTILINAARGPLVDDEALVGPAEVDGVGADAAVDQRRREAMAATQALHAAFEIAAGCVGFVGVAQAVEVQAPVLGLLQRVAPLLV